MIDSPRPASRILVITHEPLRQNLSGPGSPRARNRPPAGANATRSRSPRRFHRRSTDQRCTLAPYSFDAPESLKTLAERADVMIVQGFTLSQFPFLAALQVPIVVDLYCPFTIEHLEMITSRPGVAGRSPRRRPAVAADVDVGAIEADAAACSRCRTRSWRSATSSSAPASGSAISGSAPCTPPAGSTRGPTPRTPRCAR